MSNSTTERRPSEPISILKHSNTASSQATSIPKNARIMLSEDEDDDYNKNNKCISDNEEEEPNTELMSAEALELLQTEKVLKSGYLFKKGEKRRTWKKRWFVLRTTKLAMYKDDKEYKLLRIIDLHEIHKVVQVTTKHKYKFVFAFVTAKRLYYVQANSQIDMDDWFKQVNQAKHDLHLYETDVDPATVDRDQEFAKDVITSYKSNHILQSQRRKSSGTYDNFLSRPSGAGVTAAALASHSNTPQFFNSNEITPTMKAIDVPKNRKNSASKGLSEYAIDRNYPLSPSSDHQHQLTTIDGIASSEDDEEFSADKANIRLEEDRNRVLIEGYLLKLGRNKGWRKRWFVLRTDTLAYYEDDKEYSPHRIIPLQHIIDSLEIDPVSKHKLFCFKIIIPKRSYVLCAPAEEDMDAWLNALVVAVRRAKKECESGHIDSSYANPTAVSPTASQAQTLQQQQEQHHYPPRPLSLIPEHKPYESQQHLNSHSSADSFENMSHLSGVSGAGGVGGAGGALGGMPTSTPLTHLHSRASERLGRAN